MTTQDIKDIFKNLYKEQLPEILRQGRENVRICRVYDFNSTSCTASVQIVGTGERVDNVKYPTNSEVSIGDFATIIAPDYRQPNQNYILGFYNNQPSTTLTTSISSGGTVYTTTYTGIQGVTGGGDFTANRQFAFLGSGVTITNSILTGNSLGSNIHTGGSFLSSVLTNPIIKGGSITSSSFTGGSIGDVYITSVEITGSSLFSNSITGSSLGSNIYTGGSYANPNISGGTIDNAYITSNSVISSWTGLSTGVSIALSTGTSPVYLMKATNIDLREELGVATRHYFTQNGITKYFIQVSGVSLSGSDSYFRLISRLDTGTTTYSVFGASFPISSYNYSREKSPIGFPMEIVDWTYSVAIGTSTFSTPTSTSFYNLGGQITVPIGEWKLAYSCGGQATRAATGFAQFYTTLGLSTGHNNLTYRTYTAGCYPVNPNSTPRTFIEKQVHDPVTIDTATIYYLNAAANGANHTSLSIEDPAGSGKISATLTYV